MNDGEARAVVMVPQRDATTIKLLEVFKSKMNDFAIVCLEQHLVGGQDDWDEEEDSAQSQCWWGVFARQ